MLAVGDVSGDGYPDLLAGAPGEDVDESSSDQAGGTVTVLLGGSKGLQTKGSRQVHEVRGPGGDPGFGSLLALADVDADGRTDVVVGSTADPDLTDDVTSGGSVSVCPGAPGGPTGCRRLLRGDDEVGGITALSVGNVQGDARPEIVLGTPFLAAPVHVLSLAGTGTATTATARGFDPARDLGGSNGDVFGRSLATADLDRDGYDDLVVGAPGTDVDDEDFAGRVHVVPGGRGGLQEGRMTAYDENTRGVPRGSEADDRFGDALTLLDVSGDGRPDLTVGAPGEDNDLGSITTLRGVTTAGATRFSPSNIPDPGQADLELGAVLGR